MSNARKSDDQLIDELWDAIVPAWIFGSLGVILFLGSIIWRFVAFPPRLVIRYDDGAEVWGFRGHTYPDNVIPSMPFWTDYVFIIALISGVIIFYFGTRRWRNIDQKLRVRKLNRV